MVCEGFTMKDLKEALKGTFSDLAVEELMLVKAAIVF